MYGFVAGITVFAGVALLYALRGRASQTALGALQSFAGGILAYIALEIGAEVAEYVESLAKWETFGMFLRDSVLTTAVFAGVFLLLSWVERRAAARGMPQSLLTAFIVALAYGIHNVGECLAIAGVLLSEAVADALLFTVGFAVHNATEGFGIAAPLLGVGGPAPTSCCSWVCLSWLACPLRRALPCTTSAYIVRLFSPCWAPPPRPRWFMRYCT